MDMQAGLDELPDYPYVSTGHLPPADEIVGLVDGAYQRYKTNTDGKNSQIYPALAEVPSDLFGICVVGTNGEVHSVGDSDHEFSIMSVSKPFIFALVCEAIGAEAARGKLGANATGLPSNSLAAVDRLQTALAGTTATPAQVAEAVRVNTDFPPACAEDRPADHGRCCDARDHPGRRSAELRAGGDAEYWLRKKGS